MPFGAVREPALRRGVEQLQLRLFSTQRPFGFYIMQCRQRAPQLLDAGVFHNVYQKWPPSPLLQFAVAANQLHPLLPAPPAAAVLVYTG